jgi:hypothetical protein
MQTWSVAKIAMWSLCGLACWPFLGCTSAPIDAEGESQSETASASALPGDTDDVYKTIHDSIQDADLVRLLKDMTGMNPVTVGTETFSITDRFSVASKENFRKYWTAYFQSLGLTVNPLAYSYPVGLEAQGHDLEAVLPGKVADSLVIIVHYDSMGPNGPDNPGTDDDMTGMSTAMETARVLAAYAGRVHYTVRFVASDYEEWGELSGARQYAKYLKNLAQQQGFRIVGAIDDEQSGWKEGANTIDYFDQRCTGTTPDSSALSSLFADTTTRYSTMTTHKGCMGAQSDHYAMWEVGVPAVVFSEHDPFSNPHFDREGGDTFDRIDQAYFTQIARVGVTFAARVAGIDP